MHSNRYLNKRVTKYYLKIFLLYLYLLSSFSVHIFVEIWNVSNQLIFSIGIQLLYSVVLISAVQQSETAICLHISPPSPQPASSHLSQLSQSTAWSFLCYSGFPLATCFTLGSVYVNPNLPISSTFLFPHCVHMFVHNCVSIPALQWGSSVSFFLDSTYMH